MSEDPYKGVVADLVDPYFTPELKNAGGFRSSSPAGNYAIWWMRTHPGRWAMVGEGIQGKGTTGLTRELLRICPDIQVREQKAVRSRTNGAVRIFGCVPHPEGESLEEALARRPFSPGLFLPTVTKDEFRWTPEELAEACQLARDNLFPVS
jgi:hypothetical protein